MMLFRFFYNFCLHIFALGMVPKIALSWKKYKGTLAARLGKNFPAVKKEGKKLIWIHAVSLGETKAISPLIKKLRSWNPNIKILFSSTTQTGFQEGKKSIEADWHVFLPFDFSYIIRPIVKKVAPDWVVLTETDFWFNFQSAAKEGGAKIIVVNGKLSKKTFERYDLFPPFAKHLLEPVDHFFLQGEVYKNRFERLHLPLEKLQVTGNIKLDGIEQKATPFFEKVLTLGSTHAPEEELWISAIKEIWNRFPELKVRIVPRHPERFDEVAKLLEKANVPFGRYSRGESFEKNRLLLVDKMGVLRDLYSKSSLTFVGGSFTQKVGGHNILEPCFYGKPVLFGPYMHSQPDFLDLVTSYKAGIQLTEKNMVSIVERLLSSPEECAKMGENGLKLVETSKGALDKTLNHLINILSM